MLRKVAPLVVGQKEGKDPSEFSIWDKEEELDSFKDKENIFRQLPLNFKTTPKEEQEVIAIFFELVGRKLLKGYFPFRVGGNRATYDALFFIDQNEGDTLPPPNVRARDLKIVEFKFRLSELISDFEDQTKFLQDIDLVICWENDCEEDTSEYNVHSLEREGKTPLPGAQLRIQRGTQSCQVLVLKDFLQSNFNS